MTPLALNLTTKAQLDSPSITSSMVKTFSLFSFQHSSLFSTLLSSLFNTLTLIIIFTAVLLDETEEVSAVEEIAKQVIVTAAFYFNTLTSTLSLQHSHSNTLTSTLSLQYSNFNSNSSSYSYSDFNSNFNSLSCTCIRLFWRELTNTTRTGFLL